MMGRKARLDSDEIELFMWWLHLTANELLPLSNEGVVVCCVCIAPPVGVCMWGGSSSCMFLQWGCVCVGGSSCMFLQWVCVWRGQLLHVPPVGVCVEGAALACSSSGGVSGGGQLLHVPPVGVGAAALACSSSGCGCGGGQLLHVPPCKEVQY